MYTYMYIAISCTTFTATRSAQHVFSIKLLAAAGASICIKIGERNSSNSSVKDSFDVIAKALTFFSRYERAIKNWNDGDKIASFLPSISIPTVRIDYYSKAIRSRASRDTKGPISFSISISFNCAVGKGKKCQVSILFLSVIAIYLLRL